jgi:hypothetical protein
MILALSPWRLTSLFWMAIQRTTRLVVTTLNTLLSPFRRLEKVTCRFVLFSVLLMGHQEIRLEW